MIDYKAYPVPRSRAFQTHQAMKEELRRVMEPILFSSAREGYRVRRELEEAFAGVVDQSFACAVHSGTAGLFLALQACGVDAGDEVITVGNSDISTTAAISQCGAVPVVCDVLTADYTIDPDLVERLISPRTRAILPVDLYGHPADVKRLRPLADHYGLYIVEDAALATGARDNGRPVGAFADVTVFSFAPFKPLGCTGNGAMVVTSVPAIAQTLRLIAGYGHDPDREGVPAGHQRYIAEGFNLPLDPLQAALLLVKLPYLAEWTARRRAIARRYAAGLKNSRALVPSFRPEAEPTFRAYTVRVPHRENVFQRMLEAGIEVVIHYAPASFQHPVYGGRLPGSEKVVVTERIVASLLCLPVTPELTDAEVDFVVETLRDCVDG